MNCRKGMKTNWKTFKNNQMAFLLEIFVILLFGYFNINIYIKDTF